VTAEGEIDPWTAKQTITSAARAHGALAGLQNRLRRRVERTTKTLRVKQSFLGSTSAALDAPESAAIASPCLHEPPAIARREAAALEPDTPDALFAFAKSIVKAHARRVAQRRSQQDGGVFVWCTPRPGLASLALPYIRSLFQGLPLRGAAFTDAFGKSTEETSAKERNYALTQMRITLLRAISNEVYLRYDQLICLIEVRAYERRLASSCISARVRSRRS
jgi:hypothetical protein